MQPWIALASWGIPAVVGTVIAVIVHRNRKPGCTGTALTATARVYSLEPTGAMIEDRCVCRIGLCVEIAGRDPYDVAVRQPIDALEIAAVRPGSVVRVQVDPGDQQRVRIEFATSVRAPSVAALAAAYTRFKQTHGNDSGQWASAAELLASGRRVHGTLVSFAATGKTLRTLGRSATARPELLDAPQYVIAMEFRLRESGRVVGRNVQSIPSDQVPRLAVGLQLPCAVDTSDLAHRFVVDWERITFR